MWRLTLSSMWRRAAAQASRSLSWTSQEDLYLLCLYVVFRLSKLNASRTQSWLLFEAHSAEGYRLTFLSGMCSKASLNVALLHQRHLGDLESPPCGYTRCDPKVFRRVVLKEYCSLHLAADTVTCDQVSTVFVQRSVSTNLFCKWRFSAFSSASWSRELFTARIFF
jgi:hypothetical protein